jgi:hypothetical protein
MRDFTITADLKMIETLNNYYNELAARSRTLIEELFNYLNGIGYDLQVEKVNNSIRFCLLGLNFIVKCETLYSETNEPFKEGLISVYLIKRETVNNEVKEEKIDPPLLTYPFDVIGNVDRTVTYKQFSRFFYRDFVKKLLKYCNDNKNVIPFF